MMQRELGIPGLRTCEYLIARMQRRNERTMRTTPGERTGFFIRVSARLRSSGPVSVDDIDHGTLDDSLVLLSEERSRLGLATSAPIARTYRLIDAGIAFVTALRDRRQPADDEELG